MERRFDASHEENRCLRLEVQMKKADLQAAKAHLETDKIMLKQQEAELKELREQRHQIQQEVTLASSLLNLPCFLGFDTFSIQNTSMRFQILVTNASRNIDL